MHFAEEHNMMFETVVAFKKLVLSEYVYMSNGHASAA